MRLDLAKLVADDDLLLSSSSCDLVTLGWARFAPSQAAWLDEENMGEAKRRRLAYSGTLSDPAMVDDVICHAYDQTLFELGRPLHEVQKLVEVYKGRNLAFDAAAEKLSHGVTDCRAGCFSCCHQLVLASPFEIFAIAQLLLTTRTDTELLEIQRTLRSRLDVPLNPNDRYGLAFVCALLTDGKCSIYDRRPIACRSMHSGSRKACDEALDGISNSIPYLLDTQTLAAAMELGITAGLHGQLGLTVERVEMGGALLIALEKFDESLTLWLSGEDPFLAYRMPNADGGSADTVRGVLQRLQSRKPDSDRPK